MDARHARICPRPGTHVNQHRPLLHAISRTHNGDSGSLTNSKVGSPSRQIGTRARTWSPGSEVFRLAPSPECHDKTTLLSVTRADPQARVRLRGGSSDHDGSGASISEARKHQHLARPGQALFGERSHKLATVAVEMLSFGASRRRRQ